MKTESKQKVIGMNMIRFECDYAEGMHEKILQKLIETNEIQTAGYGEDIYCEQAKECIQKLCGKNVDVHFLVGGTQTNMTIISSILRPHQGVVACASGHVAMHETGAIESTGHKVLTIVNEDGKLKPQQIQNLYDAHEHDSGKEHTVQPKLVYISQPTENGTVYTKKELEAIYTVCRACQLYLFIDGARLGYAMATQEGNISLAELSSNCDIFYIGGTKIGAMFGEAVVIVSDHLKTDFRYHMKQKGGLLAKGRFLGIQFLTLFEDGLYFELGKHAISQAMRIKKAFQDANISFLFDSPTNQQFVLLSDAQIKELEKKYAFLEWERINEKESVIRFCTSFATKEESVSELILDIKKLNQTN